MKFIYTLFLVLPLLASAVGCSSAPKNVASSQPVKSTPVAAQVAAPAASRADSIVAAIDCQLKAEHRKLEIKPKGQGCELIYTKLDHPKNVASSSNGKTHCEKAMANIKKKLEASSFVCQ